MCIFSLIFFVGGIYIIITVERSTSKLDSLITLHQVGILREQLLLSIKRAQSDITLKNTRYSKGMEATVTDVINMMKAADSCFDCHHSESVTAKLVDLHAQLDRYTEAMSRVLTIVASPERHMEEEDAAFKIGEELMAQVNKIIEISSSNVEKKTLSATDEITFTKRILFVLIGVGPFLATGLTYIFIKSFTKPVYILGTGESVETPMVSQMETFNSSRAFKVAGPLAFQEAGITHKDVDHLMIYDAFAHLPLYGLGDLGFMPHEETGKFIADGNTRPGGKLPLNTNGGGLSYMHSGMYGMYALQESVRQMRGTAPAQVPNATISVCHGVGGMFAASGTIIFTNQR